MMEILPDILRAIVSTTGNVFLMMSLLQPKYGKKITYTAMIGILTADLGTAVFCYLSGNLTMLSVIDSILFTVLCFLVKPLFKDTFMQWLFSYITIQNISDMIIVISFVCSRRLPYPAYANVLIRLLLFLGAYLLLRFKVRPLYRQIQLHWNVFFYVAFTIWIIYTYVVFSSDDIVDTLTRQAPLLMLITALAIAAYVSVCHTLYTLSQEHAILEDKLLADSRQNLLQTELASQEAYVNFAKQTRHDIRHHDALLMDYLERGDVELAKEYLKIYDQSISEVSYKQYCSNATVNAVLRLFERRAAQSGILFEIKTVVPEKLDLTAPEICELFSNLLENACEACDKVEGSKFIDLDIQIKNERLQIEMKNAVSGKTTFDEEGNPVSSKKEGGRGTKGIREIVQKHNGMLFFSQNENVFYNQIILPIK